VKSSVDERGDEAFGVVATKGFLEGALTGARFTYGKLSVKEIAAATGFRDANRFCKAFRQSYQLSPGEYRRLAGSSP